MAFCLEKNMKFNLISIFPNSFSSYLQEGIISKALEKKIIKTEIINLRDFTTDKRKTVDDTIYGGGAGMLLKIEPLYKALKKIKKTKDKKIFLLSASGKTYNQKEAQKLSKLKEVTLICGRYEGVDARIKKYIDGEFSVGDYVLSGGELGALVILDSVTRLLPGVLGNKQSLEKESHSSPGYLEYPQYTKPEVFMGNRVPKVLVSGNHQKIEKWREIKEKKKK